MSKFMNDLVRFNQMYALPTPKAPTMLANSQEATIQRLMRFKEILQDELNEIDDVIDKFKAMGDDAMPDLADWLADVQVYAASEAVRFGFDNDAILDIVMQSNFSKLDADGKPIIVNGKVGKGPNYWKPEPALAQYIADARDAAGGYDVNGYQVGGSHYRQNNGAPQHWDLAIMYRWDPFQYQITKYVMRWKDKHHTPEAKLVDLKKAAHFLEKYISVYQTYLPQVEAPQPQEMPNLTPLVLGDPQAGNEHWSNEGYYGDNTCLYKCAKCRQVVRAASVPLPHACPTAQPGQQNSP